MTFRLLSTGTQTLSVLPLTRTPGTARDVVSWDRVPDAIGFRFTVLGKLSHTWDGASTSVKVAKGQPIIVEALLLGPVGDDPPVTPPPPPPSGVAAPGSTGEKVTTISGVVIGVNLHNPPAVVLTDYIIDGTADSAVLLQPGSTGNILERFKITRVHHDVPQATHAVYCKSRGNRFLDFYLDNTNGQANNGISNRMGDNFYGRMKIRGFNFSAAHFEHDGQAGTVTFEDIDGDSTNSETCVWMDDSNEPPSPGIKHAFVFRRVHLSGGKMFVNCRAGSYIGAGLRFEGCTINGRALTLADIGPGFPRNKLTIV